jgi:hypothetical protein
MIFVYILCSMSIRSNVQVGGTAILAPPVWVVMVVV